MKLKETLAAASAALLVLFIAVWLMSETKIFALQDIDKEFIDHQVSTMQRSVDEVHQEAQNLNERLEGLEELNRTLKELNSHLESIENLKVDVEDRATKIYKEMITEFQRLNDGMTQMHADQAALLETIRKLAGRFSPFLGSDD